jgi:hypothetical protein
LDDAIKKHPKAINWQYPKNSSFVKPPKIVLLVQPPAGESKTGEKKKQIDSAITN